MTCPEYPKIETLFVRDKGTFRVTEELRCPEFGAIKEWEVTEKIDGMNVRIHLPATRSVVEVYGRTAAAVLPAPLSDYIFATFTRAKLRPIFENAIAECVPVTLYGEGYGPKIQKGGNYRSDVAVRLFDIRIGRTWLKRQSVCEIADQMNVDVAPYLGLMDLDDAIQIVRDGYASQVACADGGNVEYPAEGIVARSSPLMLDRMGRRVAFKLKARDFA